MRPFQPLVSNPHLLTILGNFWPRKYDFAPYPMESRLIRTDDDTQVLVQTQRPQCEPIGEVVLVHGLEGAGDAGYIVSMAWAALQAGFIAHRFHMRTCGGTAAHCKTLYHGGLTSDLRAFLQQTHSSRPRFLIGFSLGGNVCLKLAGELGETDLIQGVCAISSPIDLGMAARRIGQWDNWLYQNRFVDRMKARLLSTGRYTPADLKPLRTLYEIDDKITAPSFGFGTADNYYATQSSKNFLARIRVPALVIAAKDDTFIPFAMYRDPVFQTNPNLTLIAPDHGGHLGFLARGPHRFWADETVMEFLTGVVYRAPVPK
jgi:predicted alpha/beta-fold hydrolase